MTISRKIHHGIVVPELPPLCHPKKNLLPQRVQTDCKM